MRAGRVFHLASGIVRRLTRNRDRCYHASNAITQIALPAPDALERLATDIAEALDAGSTDAVRLACQQLVDGVCAQLGLSAPEVRVLRQRPATRSSETHGLYEFGTKHQDGRITVWMLTARRAQVVAYRTFLRTLLHELCHHLDLRLLGLAHTFHTAGFYRREGSLMRQLSGR